MLLPLTGEKVMSMISCCLTVLSFLKLLYSFLFIFWFCSLDVFCVLSSF
nr:MAG TPA: hypothetical protein [Microviridae sp.]